MPFPDGTPLGDLFGGPLSGLFRDIADRFTTDGVTSTPFAGGTQHSGTLKSVQDDPINLGFGELELPGITAGTPFRLALFDSPEGRWHLDIVFNGVSLKLRDLHGADFVREAGTTPRRLVRRAQDTAVVISGEAVIRFAKASDDAAMVVLFVEDRSASDPLANTGAVVNLRCSPPHFFFGSSQFGMTLSEILFDASDTFSPQFIVSQGQTAEWMGFAVAEATFYAPPNATGQGGFSGGVRNLLIGAPRGLQGEFEIQWGRAPLDPSTFIFTQNGHPATGATGSGSSRLVAITAGQDSGVVMDASFIASQPPEGGAVTDWGATWRWPDGSESIGDISSGTVAHGQVLRIIPEERIPGRPIVYHPEIMFRFVASGAVPEIDVITAGTSVVNAIHVAGPKAGMAGLSFRARSTASTTGTFTWKLGPDGTDKTGVSANFSAAEIGDDSYLILRETNASGHDRVARLRVQVQEGQVLLVGGEDGVVDAAAPTSPITPAAVEGTYDLADFRAQGRYTATLDDAEIYPALPERVAIPGGSLAMVTIDAGGPAVPPAYDRHIQVLFEFNKGKPIAWGTAHPVQSNAFSSPAGLHSQLLDWAANYPGADFLIIGRCDDLGSNALNATLAHTRRDTILSMFTSAAGGSSNPAIAAARLTANWGEQDGQLVSLSPNPLGSEESAAQRLILAEDDITSAALTDRTGWPTEQETSHEAEITRRLFRRVDIYAVGGTPTQAAAIAPVSPARAPNLRRMLMPGETIDPVPAEVATPEMDYRVKLLAAWDKPSGEGFKDLIPSKAEFEFAWSPDDHPLPTLGGDPVTLEVLTVYGSWRHEDLTGFTRTQLGIRSDGDPDGLIRFDQPNVVAAMALGPVLLSGVDSTTDTVEKAGRIAALAAGTAFAQVDLGGGPLLGSGSKAAVKSIEATAEIKNIEAVGNDYKISLTSDYSTTLHINTGRLGLRTDPEHPVKFRYNDVGIVFDKSKTDFWDKLAVAYPTDALTIEDPGKWRIEGVLGEMLRAVETALGTGSIWFETRFAFALTIGVVEISEAVIRVTFDGSNPIPDFSLRGLVAKIDIPNTVKGEGRLRIEDPGGVIKAGIDLEIIPIKLKASAAFAMASFTTPVPYTFVNLFAKVQFPAGIPLGPSGAALHGFIGQTVINGTRDIISSTDIVKRELGWWAKKPEDKYKPLKDQHALGLGAVVGTLPDASFCLSATGMIVVAFPDPEVILAVEINILSVPDRTAKEASNGSSASITGLIVIDDTAVSLAAQARYEIPQVLKVTAPFAAYFPYSGNGIYVRIGSDGEMGRTGEPVTLTLLPSTINLKAFSYLMIEQDGLPSLGGRPDFSFQGFSVGFGAGAGLEWKAGPIKLSASILLLAGFGTDPILIKAGIYVKGELDLVVISVSARGEIELTYQNDTIWMDGEFCGEVDCWFFSIKGCVRFRIGHEPTIPIPPPPDPAVSVMLIDRGGRVMGEALAGGGGLQALPIFQFTEVNGTVQNSGADPRDNHTVWADTAPVINFRHFAKDAIPDGHQFNPLAQPSGERWFGSNRLKYAYRLDDVRLVRESDGVAVAGTKPLQSVWTTSPARQPGSGGAVQPSGAEVTSLKLLDWQPWTWALPMADGGASAPGDPAQTIHDLCTPIPQPIRACLFGKDARGFGPFRIRIFHETPPSGPYPSFFTLLGRPAIRGAAGIVEGASLIALVTAAGGLPMMGEVVNLPQPVAGPAGPLTAGYRLPAMQIARAGAVVETTMPWIADFDRTVRRGRIFLMVCDGARSSGEAEPTDCYRFEGLSVGKSFSALTVPGYELAALGPRQRFTVTDDVRLVQGDALPGADQKPDIRIAQPGLAIRPTRPVRALSLHFYRDEAVPTEIRWKDAAGGSHSFVEPGADKGSVRVRVAAPADIVEIQIVSRARFLHLVEICAVSASEAGNCFDFAGLRKDVVAQGRFTHAETRFTALDPQSGFRLVDQVDAGSSPAQRGSDGTAELQFPAKGVELVPAVPWSHVTIGIWSGGGEVKAIAYDAGGNVIAHAAHDARDPIELYLAATGIARIIVSGGSNEAVIWRLCQRTVRDERGCFDFGDKPLDAAERLERGDMVFAPAKADDRLALVDVLTDADPLKVERDGRVELMIPRSGLVVTPVAPLADVTFYVALVRGGKVEAVAYDKDGNKIAVDGSSSDSPALLRLHLAGDGIVRITIEVSGRAFLTRVCSSGSPSGKAVANPDRSLPVITTRVGKASRVWTPSVVGTVNDGGGRTCRLVAYDQPASIVDAPGFDMVSPLGSKVTLLSVCAVDTRAEQTHSDDQVAQADLSGAVVGAATADPAQPAREVLLDPGEAYRVEVDWSWQGWKSNEEGTDSPPAIPPDSDWQAGGMQQFRFRIAAEELNGSDTQDGLNEYLFDPRDLARYLGRTEPADGRDTVFTDDPLWVHFNAGHVEALADRYDRELVLQVRRTDPPPQPSAAAMELAVWPTLVEYFRVKGPHSTMSEAEKRINTAISEAPCLPDGPAVGGASLGARFRLEKNAMYDFNLLAVRKGAAPAALDPVVVNATRFKTSRYKDPAEMLAALGFPTGVAAPFAPQEIILGDAMTLPSGPLSVSDLDLGAALAAIGADTLSLPGEEGRTIALWRHSGGIWSIAGFLLDAPESMRREAAVIQGDQAVDTVRCEPDRMIMGATSFLPVRATLNWTRVLFVAASPAAPTDEAQLELRFKVGLGATLTGRRVVNSKPLMVQTEGF